MEKDNLQKKSNPDYLKYEIAYYLGSAFLIFGSLVALMGYLTLHWLLETFLVIVFGAFGFWVLLETFEPFLDFVLTEKKKKDIGFYIVRWKSKEFEEFVGDDLVVLYEDSNRLFEYFDSKRSDNSLEFLFSDISFLLLPIAKAYEGVLKKILVSKKVLTLEDLEENPSINVGAYFNPVGNEKISTLLKDRSRDRAIPHVIYSTYQECRNQILHFDGFRVYRISSFGDARFHQKRILDAIDKAYETFCT